MKECSNCKKLMKRLSPMEDEQMTSAYLNKEPRTWISKQKGKVRGEAGFVFKAPDLFKKTFGKAGTKGEITKLGRTLDALGFTRLKRDGYLFHGISEQDFNA